MNEPFAIPEEFWPLLNALYDGELNPETWATLESYLAENPGAQLAFVDYVWLRTEVRRWTKSETARDDVLARIRSRLGRTDGPGATPPIDHGSAVEMPADLIGPAVEGSPSVANRHCPLPVHHASVLQSLVGSMLCSYVTLALFLAAGLLAAWAWKTSDNSRPAAGDRAVASAAPTFIAEEKRIGRITALVNCRWALPATATTMGADVIAERCFGLESGMLEITYDTGAKVVLKGPALFSAPSRATGWLLRGKVTVSTPPVADQPLFCIRTPTVVVIERGDCQFGVDVEMGAEATQPDGGRHDVNLEKPAMSRIYVFRGKAEFHLPERWAPQKAS